MMVECGSLNQFSTFSIVVIVLPLIFSISIQAMQDNKSAKAKFYETPDGLGTPSGACGYGEYGRNISNGYVAAVSSHLLYKSGAGCGACYQVKCSAAECNKRGVKVVATDSTSTTNETEFILTYRAFASMAAPGKDKGLREKGVVDVQYKRIGCDYGAGQSLRVKILGQSSYPYYLSFVFLYQAGTSPITGVQVFQERFEWRECRRAYGAVWEISSPPEHVVTMRVLLNGSNSTWVLLPNVIPHPWTPGASYATSARIP